MPGELKAGARLGRHDLLVEVGRGGMASVWVALRAADGAHREELVAIKAMLPELGRDPNFRSMFLDEGQLARSIDHPNVAKVHEVGEEDGALFMALEWVVGDSLRTIIRAAEERKPIPVEIAARVIADAAAGLHAAHELRGWDGELRGLVHCDVSPHNILIGLDGVVKVVDFGVASAAGAMSELDEGRVRGKFGYMSPEQTHGQKLDRRSDVFSLGIVLFELTTGQRLFAGRDRHHSIDLVRSAKIPSPLEFDPKYPAALARVVERALRRDPGDRYQTADEMRAALEGYLVEARVVVPRAGVSGLLRRVLRRRLEQLREAVRAELAKRGGAGSGLARSAPTLTAEDISSVSVSEVGLESDSRSWASSPSASGVAQFVPPSERSSTGFGTQTVTSSHPSAPERSIHAPRAPRALLGATFVLGVLAGVVGTLAGLRLLDSDDRADATALFRALGTAPHEESAGAEPTKRPGHASSIDDLEVVQEADARSARVERESTPGDRAARREEAVRLEETAKTPAKEVAPVPATAPTARTEPPASEDPVPPAGERGPVNRGAMMAALGTASRAAAGCKRAGGPSGSGRVSVTFEPSGAVSSAAVGGKFAGTDVGSCVSAAFRRARVPAFTGSSVTLGWSFSIAE